MTILVKDTFTAVDGNFYKDTDAFLPVLSGDGEDLLVMQGNAQASQTGRTLSTALFGTEPWDQDQVGPQISLISFFMHRLSLSVKNALIPIISSTNAITWSGTMTNAGSGIGLHLQNVDQTNPYVDQSATSGIQEESFSSSVPTDLTFTCLAGDIVIYTLTNSTLDPSTITNFTRVNRGAIGGGDTNSPQLDEGATYYWIPGSDQTNATIPAPVGSSSGYHSVQVYKAAAAPSDQNISPSGIASTIVFGSTTVQLGTELNISPSGIASTSVVGSATVVTVDPDLEISPSGIPPTVAFGTPSIEKVIDLSPTGIASTVAFGTANVQIQAELNISPNGISSTLVFGTTQITQPNIVSVTDPLLDASIANSLSVENFNSDIISVKIVSGSDETVALNLSGTGDNYTFDLPDITGYVIDTLGSPLDTASHNPQVEVTDGTNVDTLDAAYNPKAGFAVVEALNATKDPGSIYEGFVGPAPTDGSQCYYPTAFNTTVDADGTLNTDSGADIDFNLWDIDDSNWKQFTVSISQLIEPTGIVSTAAFGNPTVQIEAELDVSPVGITSTLAFGNPTVQIDSGQNISPPGIASTATFGNPTVSIEAELNILPNGIVSTIAFGTVIVETGVSSILPIGIASTVAFGVPEVSIEKQDISPSGIASTLVFGALNVQVENDLEISPSGITSTITFGTATVQIGTELDILPNGIASTIIFGDATVQNGPALNVSPNGITSTSNFGDPTVVLVAQIDILPTGIPSTLQFGTPTVQIEIIIITVVPAPPERTFEIELENRTFTIEKEDRTFVVKAGDETVKTILKDPQAKLNYSFDLNEWIESDDSLASFSLAVSANLTLEAEAEINNIITGVVSGGAPQGNESIVCTFNTTNGLKDERTILLEMGDR